VVPAELGRLPEYSYDSLRRAADGTVFLVMMHGIYRVNPDTCAVTLAWKMPAEDIEVTGPIVGRRLFFGTQWKLRYVDL